MLGNTKSWKDSTVGHDSIGKTVFKVVSKYDKTISSAIKKKQKV